MKLSVGRAWDEAQRSLPADFRIVIAVASAFFVLPALLTGLLLPPSLSKPGSLAALPIILFVMWLGFIGNVAIQRLTLIRGEKVSEALRQAPLRALWLLGALMLVLVPLSLLLAPFSAGLMSGDPAQQSAGLAAILAIFVIALIPLSRLTLAPAVAAFEKASVLTIIRRSWQLTKGATFRLYGLWMAALFAFALLNWVSTFAIGSAVRIAFGPPQPFSLSLLLILLASQLLQLLISLPMVLVSARLYRQATGDQEHVGVPDAGGH